MTCKDCLHYPVCHALAVNEQAPLVPPHECAYYSYSRDWLYLPSVQGLFENEKERDNGEEQMTERRSKE